MQTIQSKGENKMREFWKNLTGFGKLGVISGVFAVSCLVLLIAFRLMFVTFVENYELGYLYDSRTGSLELLNRTGYILQPPFVVSIHTIDLRPMQVCLNANARNLNCKLVKFNPEGFQTFISWHGRNDYRGGNCSSLDGDGCGNLGKILSSYAFDPNKTAYPFLTEMESMGGH